MAIRFHFKYRFEDEKLIPTQRLGIGDRKFSINDIIILTKQYCS
jgi:hypothetical protein